MPLLLKLLWRIAKPLLKGIGLLLLFLLRKMLWKVLKAAGKQIGKLFMKIPWKKIFQSGIRGLGKAFNKGKNLFGNTSKVNPLDENRAIQTELAKTKSSIFTKHKNPTIGGVVLSVMQNEDLLNGKAVLIEDMQRKNGGLLSAYVKMNDSGTLSFSLHNPDSPPLSRVRIPGNIDGVVLTENEKDALRANNPVYLDGMVNPKGETFSSFVKIDRETGKICYSENGFNEILTYKVPQEIKGIALKETEKALLKEGRSIFIADMTADDGNKFSAYVKMNAKIGKLEFFRDNPERPRQHNILPNNLQSKTTVQKQKSVSKLKVA